MSGATPSSAAQKELQSTLLRSTIICATSIQSLREPVQPDVIAADAAQLPPPASQLSAQVISDLVQIFALVQKHCNALSLALRPSAATSSSSSSPSPSPSAQDAQGFSPVSGLDDKSLEAAKAQIVSLSSDLIPKMVFIAKKAWKDREVFQLDAQLAAEHDEAQREERRKLEQLAKQMGGQVMTSQQLGLEGQTPANAAQRKLVSRSLGNAFAREVRAAVEDVLGCIAELLQSFLDARTRAALQHASNARDKADGLSAGPSSSAAAAQHQQQARNIHEARRKSLELNNLVWETCAKYIGKRAADGSATTVTHVNPNGNKVKVQVKGLSRDNLEASKRIWQERVAIMRDGLDEMKEAAAADDDDDDGDVDDDEEAARSPRHLGGDADDLDLGEELSALPTLSVGERARLSQLSNLVRIGSMLHENVLKAIVAAHGRATSDLDLDEVDDLGRQLEEAQDELVAAALYGEEDAGIEELDLGDDDDDDDDDDGQGHAAVEEGSIEAAVLRTLQQYVRAAAALVSYVSGNDEPVEKVDAVDAGSTTGEFEGIFEARFSRLSKVLTEASSNIQVRPTRESAKETEQQQSPPSSQTSAPAPTPASASADAAQATVSAAAPAVSEAQTVAMAATTAAVVAPAAAAAAATAAASDSAPVDVPSKADSGVIAAARKPSNAAFQTADFLKELDGIAQRLGNGTQTYDRAVAAELDRIDPLAPMRDGYVLPKNRDVCQPSSPSPSGSSSSPAAPPTDTDGESAPDAPALYMCGNSLGPLPKLTKHYLDEELEAWGRKAVLGHFDHPYDRPWTQLEGRVAELSADVVGAKRAEVTVMGTLTGNLHTMLTTFYRPAVRPYGVGYAGSAEEARGEGRKVRHKIVYEHKAFPSDRYALASAIELNGFDVATSLVPLRPRGDSRTFDTADILATIDELGREGETCLILLGGINFFTGQLFECERIAAKAREHGILFGVDLAHAFANVPLRLHDWGVDFAVWCTYKYGSAGPGGIAGLFVHEKWHQSGATSRVLTRQAGWWGHDRSTRFSMPEDFAPIEGADGWQVSNPSMLDMAALRGSLETLLTATQLSGVGGAGDEDAARGEIVGEGKIMPVLRSKSLRLTAYLESLLLRPGFLPEGLGIEIVTPRDPQQRGSQLCIRIPDQREPAAAAAAAPAASGAEGGKGGVPPPIQSTRLIARAHLRAEKQRGLVTDIRHPDMLRIAPLAQFSSYVEVWRTAEALRLSILEEMACEKQQQ